MDRIAAQDDGAHLWQLDEQAGMARRVPRRAQHDHRAVTEHVLVDGQRLDLALAFDPALERLDVHAFSRLGAGDRVPFLAADQQGCFRKRRNLAGVIGVIVADADIFDLLGFDVDLRQVIDSPYDPTVSLGNLKSFLVVLFVSLLRGAALVIGTARGGCGKGVPRLNVVPAHPYLMNG